MMHLAVAALLALAQNDKTQANSYDNAWEASWKAHCQSVINVAGKTPGFVLHIGDSITHTWAYGGWIDDASNSGTHSSEDTTLIVNWLQQDSGHRPGGIVPTSTNGLYLAMVDVGNRSMTASSGISAAEYLTGTGNGGTAMPSTTNTATAQGYVASTTYDRDLHITTVAAAFNKAQFAVVMLGTNDCSQNRTAAAFIADLQTIVATLEAQNIAPVLSTIPPHHANQALGQQYNTEIRNFAQSHGLPLIDFYAEILARRSGTSWNGTLLGMNDVHPTASGGGFTHTSSPYAGGGDVATHRTGTPCDNVGYLLRSWLTVQKLKEVKFYVIDNGTLPTDADADGLPDAWEVTHFGNTAAQNGSGNPDGDAFTNAQEFSAGTDPNDPASPAPSPAPTPTPAPTGGGGGGGGGGKCGGAIDGPASPTALLIVALALLLVSRKSGF